MDKNSVLLATREYQNFSNASMKINRYHWEVILMNYQRQTLIKKLKSLSEVNTNTPAFHHNKKRANDVTDKARKLLRTK